MFVTSKVLPQFLKKAQIRSCRLKSSETFNRTIHRELENIEKAGTFKHERIITSPQRSSISVESSDKEVLNFCANNYLGLSDHPDIVDASKTYLDSHGFGLSSVRFICGTQDVHKQLEQKIADFHEKQDTILYASCFDANAGIFEALLTAEDAVISDELNHASIIDGIRLCKAKRYRYKHMDLADLEAQLQAAEDESRNKLVVTDGVFSMDGDIAPLNKIADLCDKYDALLLVDECHATGFLGATGRGTPEYHNVMDRVDIVNSTLGKALGGATGGYTTASSAIVSLLRQKSRPYLFSNTLAPSLAGASIKVFDMISGDTTLRDQLERNTVHFRQRMAEAGFTLAGADHPIVPVMLGDARLAAEFADEMLAQGIYVIGFSYPVVPKGKARIRVQLSAAHTQQQIDNAIDAFIQVGKSKRIID